MWTEKPWFSHSDIYIIINLPDFFLYYILSFLPTQDVISNKHSIKKYVEIVLAKMHTNVYYEKVKFNWKTCQNPSRRLQRPYNTIWNASALTGTECHLKCICTWEGRKENCVGHHVKIKGWDKREGKLIYQVGILNYVFNFFIT